MSALFGIPTANLSVGNGEALPGSGRSLRRQPSLPILARVAPLLARALRSDLGTTVHSSYSRSLSPCEIFLSDLTSPVTEAPPLWLLHSRSFGEKHPKTVVIGGCSGVGKWKRVIEIQ